MDYNIYNKLNQIYKLNGSENHVIFQADHTCMYLNIIIIYNKNDNQKVIQNHSFIILCCIRNDNFLIFELFNPSCFFWHFNVDVIYLMHINHFIRIKK